MLVFPERVISSFSPSNRRDAYPYEAFRDLAQSWVVVVKFAVDRFDSLHVDYVSQGCSSPWAARINSISL